MSFVNGGQRQGSNFSAVSAWQFNYACSLASVCPHVGGDAHLLTAAALASPAHCGDWLHHPVIHIVKISWALAVGLVGKVGEINVARLQGFVA